MDQVFSARISEEVSRRIGELARRLGKSKKAIIERAIDELSRQIEKEQSFDFFSHTHGVWQRDESAGETVAAGRKAFNDSIKRHKK